MTPPNSNPLQRSHPKFFRWLQSEGVRFIQLTSDLASSGFLFLPKSPKSPKSMVVYLHGLGNDSALSVIKLFKTLLSRNIAVLSFDLPGHGRESSHILTFTSLYSETNQILQQFLEQSSQHIHPDITRHVIGYSLGGAILLRHPELCSQFKTTTIVAAPFNLRIKLRDLVWEPSGLLTPGFAGELMHYASLIQGIPALGRLNRQHYPLRTNPTRNLTRDAKEYFDSRHYSLTSSSVYHFCYGGLDGVAKLRDLKIFLDQHQAAETAAMGEVLKVARGTHLNILTDKKLHAFVAEKCI